MADSHFLDAGVQNFQASQFEASLYEFKRAERTAPNDPVVHYYMGSSLARLNRADEALDHFKRAFELAPPNSKIKALAAQALSGISHLTAPQEKMQPLAQVSKGKATLHKATASPDDLDPDNALLKATGGIPEPPPLLQSQPPLSKEAAQASEIEARCTEIQDQARKRVEEMKSNVIRTAGGEMHIYSNEDIQDVIAKANAECNRLRSTLKRTAGTNSDAGSHQPHAQDRQPHW